MRAWLPVLLMVVLLGCSPEAGPTNAEKLNSGRPNLFGNGASKKPSPASDVRPEADAGTQPAGAPHPTRVIGSPAGSAGEVPLIPTGRWTDLKPCTPLLELKRDQHGAWAWHHGEKTLDTASREAETALDGFAKHKHHGTGWQGLAPNGVSRNLALVLVDAEAPARLVCWFMERTMAAQIGQVAVGLRGIAAAPRDTQKCAQADTLGADYLVYTAPVDEGLHRAPSIPKETCWLAIGWSDSDRTFDFTPKIDARGNKLVPSVPGSVAQYHPGSPAKPADAAAACQLRDKSVSTLADALHDVITRFGTSIERLEYAPALRPANSSVPWLALELAWRACEETKRRMYAAGATTTVVSHPWENQIPEPPSPKQPPEMEVEFPRDEPANENPTEDERIVED